MIDKNKKFACNVRMSTTELRFQIRKVPYETAQGEILENFTEKKTFLQQKWIKEDCEDVWLDVPYVNEK